VHLLASERCGRVHLRLPVSSATPNLDSDLARLRELYSDIECCLQHVGSKDTSDEACRASLPLVIPRPDRAGLRARWIS
jgi:hypothetical protein